MGVYFHLPSVCPKRPLYRSRASVFLEYVLYLGLIGSHWGKKKRLSQIDVSDFGTSQAGCR